MDYQSEVLTAIFHVREKLAKVRRANRVCNRLSVGCKIYWAYVTRQGATGVGV